MKNFLKNTKTMRVLAIALIVVFSLLLSYSFKSNAGSLTSVYMYLSRIKANLNGAGDDTVEYVLAFSTSQQIPTGGTITLTFPDDEDGMWCRNDGALIVAPVTNSDASDLSGTNWAIDAGLPTTGSLSATCTQGTGSTSVDTIVISNVDTLTMNTTYGVKLANGSSAGVIGTDDTAGTHYVTLESKSGNILDSSTFGIALLADDQVVITATVASTPSVTCSISANSVNLGSLYPGGSYATGSHTISASTSSTAQGYYWAVYGQGDGNLDAGLYKSTPTTYLIASTGSATIDLRGASTEGFGLVASDPDTVGAAVVSSDFADNTPGVFGALDRGLTGAQLLISQNEAQTVSESSTITYGAKAGTSAQTGSYQETVTFICGGYY